MRSIPFFPIAGTHDHRTDSSIFPEVFALFENGAPKGREHWYSFDWGPVHIVGLDSDEIGDAQLDWLDADLAATRQPWRIVFMHRPPFSNGWHGSSAYLQWRYVPVFQKHGVQLVVTGHDHSYERTHPINGITYVVSGGAGKGTRPVGSSDFTAYSEAVAHFGYIAIDGDTLRFNAIDATGHDFDTVVITR
jgi:3',5'-cyclic AMP phosphodiesterase CpdA